MQNILQKKIIGYETLGFVLIIILLWLDEILDFPHYLLGAPATPINWQESLLESSATFLLGIYVIYMSYRMLRKMKYLEGFLPVCSFCKKIRIDNEWIQLEQYISAHSDAVFSHSLCPDCMQEHYGDILKKAKDKKDLNI
jgi:hypothetical protein